MTIWNPIVLNRGKGKTETTQRVLKTHYRAPKAPHEERNTL